MTTQIWITTAVAALILIYLWNIFSAQRAKISKLEIFREDQLRMKSRLVELKYCCGIDFPQVGHTVNFLQSEHYKGGVPMFREILENNSSGDSRRMAWLSNRCFMSEDYVGINEMISVSIPEGIAPMGAFTGDHEEDFQAFREAIDVAIERDRAHIQETPGEVDEEVKL